MSRRAVGWIGVVVGLAAVQGCGGSTTTVRAPDPAPSITVLDPGGQPRQHLRYAPTPHVPERAEQTLKLRTNVAFTNTVLETGHRSADLPSVKILGRFDVTDVTPTGDALVTYAVEDVTVLDDVVDPAMRRYVGANVARMKGSRGSWRMSPTGAISNVVFDAPNTSRSAASSGMRDSLREAMVVFPDVAVGVGATWHVSSRYSSSNVVWDRKVTFRLTALTDAAATIEADVVMHAPSQALSVEPNATTKVTSGTTNSRTELIVPLHGLVATGTVQGTSELNFSIVRKHLRITSTVQTVMMASFKPVAAGQP